MNRLPALITAAVLAICSSSASAGTYLAAATAYATIYDRSPVGNSFDTFGKVDADTRAKLQAIAWDTVKRFHQR
ncbi:MAG: hypothetical protein VW339_10035 [Quisquiliibacterium sp.]